ncbi:MAG: hypothetical protein MJ112_05660 [Lachnospiraceae bacterium]|nr:hypothetical protein [Lachnospiraceae bacterium]
MNAVVGVNQNQIIDNYSYKESVRSEGSETLPGLSAGSSITGKITSLKGDTATIDVAGQKLDAKLDGSMNLREGQTVTFTVRQTGDQSVTLSPLYTNMNTEGMASKALSAAGLPITDQSLEVATTMMEKGLSIDKNALADMVHITDMFPGQDICKLAEMQRFGLDINENTLVQFDAFKNYENQITDGLTKIMDSIPSTINDLINNGATADGVKLLTNVIGTITDSAASQMDASVVQGMGETGESLLREKQVITEDMVLAAKQELDPDVDALVSQAGKESVASQEAFEATVRVPGQEAEKINIDIENKVADAWKVMDNSDKSAMVDVLKQSGLTDNEAKFLLSDNANASDFLRATADLLRTDSLPDSMREMIQSNDFGNIMKSQMQAQWLLSPIDVGSKETVESLYQRLNNQTREIMSAVSEVTPSNTIDLQQSLSNMNQSMDFMEQMNQMVQYMQLPLKMNGSEATGDLFVYTNKKNLAEKEGNVSALLHLDMKNLGPIDVYASLSPGNNVFTKFYLPDESMIDFINDNIHILNERLEGRGYSIKAEVTKNDGNGIRPDNPGKIGQKDEGKRVTERMISKISFDALA